MKLKTKKTLKTFIILLFVLFFVIEGFAENSTSSEKLALAYQMTFREVAQKTLPVVCEINVVNIVKTKSLPDAFEFFFGESFGFKKKDDKDEGGSFVIRAWVLV